MHSTLLQIKVSDHWEHKAADTCIYSVSVPVFSELLSVCSSQSPSGFSWPTESAGTIFAADEILHVESNRVTDTWYSSDRPAAQMVCEAIKSLRETQTLTHSALQQLSEEDSASIWAAETVNSVLIYHWSQILQTKWLDLWRAGHTWPKKPGFLLVLY